MTDLVKQTIENAKDKAISSISQYRTEIMMNMIRLRIENDRKDSMGIPCVQELDICDEMDESITYIDKLIERIKTMEFK